MFSPHLHIQSGGGGVFARATQLLQASPPPVVAGVAAPRDGIPAQGSIVMGNQSLVGRMGGSNAKEAGNIQVAMA